MLSGTKECLKNENEIKRSKRKDVWILDAWILDGKFFDFNYLNLLIFY